MVILSLSLRPTVNRRLNIVLGIVYTIIMIATMRGAWLYYIFLGVVECILTLLIVWCAWRWPRQPVSHIDQ